MLVSPIPSVNRILFPKSKNNLYWKNCVFTSRSGVSVRLIIDAYREVLKKDKINISIPSYFCAETEAEFSDSNVNILRYPLLDDFEPDWKYIKENNQFKENDIFVFVHFFGEYHDINRARTFCDNNNCILIEDCAHVLYKYGKMAQKGDFVLFSPHKLLGLMDGAVILCNNSEKNEGIYKVVQQKSYVSKKTFETVKWRLKKIVQKIIRRSRKTNYCYQEHYLETRDRTSNIAISTISYNIIKSIDEEELKKIAYRRRENLKLMNYVIKEVCPDICEIISEENESPFFAVYSLEKVENKEAVISQIKGKGIEVLFWPSLSPIVANGDQFETTRKYSKNLFMIPIHQDIKMEDIAKYAKKDKKSSNSMMVKKIGCEQEERKKWNDILAQSELSNITQDWGYAEAKSKAEGWGVDRFFICKDQNVIGVVQILRKKVLGVTVAVRINKGPVFVKEENQLENELQIVDMVRKRYYKLLPIVWDPYSTMSNSNFIKMIQNGWKVIDIYGFPSGTVDLLKAENEIRAALNSKWRNQLKMAEKSGYSIEKEEIDFEKFIQCYRKEQEDKKFEGVNERLLREINELSSQPLRFFYVKNKLGEVIAFDIFYRHEKAATYYIGWNNEEGRKACLNNLLLYHAAIELKKEGVEILDLGGIEYIHTESIAKFKDGMNPKHFRQMGEFVKI